MKIRINSVLYLLPLLIAMVGCYPNSQEYTSDYDLIGAVRSPDFDFNTASTFALPDSIVFIKDEDDSKTYITDDQEKQIIANVRGHFISMGWVDSSYAVVDTLPDVVVTITGIATKYSGSYWNYWGWYGGGWYGGYPGYGWGGGYYPGYGYPTYYEYTTGTIILDMVDWKNIEEYVDTEKNPFVWGGAMNGLVNRTPVSISKVNESIDKMFELSPYLNKK